MNLDETFGDVFFFNTSIFDVYHMMYLFVGIFLPDSKLV